MSLKHFHIIFIICSTLLGIIFSGWGISNYQAAQKAVYLWVGMGSLAVSIALAVYGVGFIKKIDKL